MSRKGIARLNSDGGLDTGFNPGSGANSNVEYLALQSDGKVLIGGAFTNFNRTARIRIARLNGDGSLDAGFDAGLGANDSVFSVAVQSDGKVLIGGWFTNVNGTTRNFVARLNSDGTLDASFDPGANNTVYSVAVQSDGKILIGGDFSMVKGTSRNRITRLNSDGSLDGGFNPDRGQTARLILWPCRAMARC